MDHTTPIDLATWPRREQFGYYSGEVPVSYTITVEVDVTELQAALKAAGRKTYLAQVWALATVVNRHPEFRMTRLDGGAPAVWDRLHPAFTVFNPDRETFAIVWSPYDEDFVAFHDRAAEVLRDHRHATTFTPQALPPNFFDVSSLPWTSFTGFTLHIAGGWTSLTPVFTLGRFTEREGRTLLPMAVQAHHAAADGFHTARLIEDFRELVGEPSWVGAADHQSV